MESQAAGFIKTLFMAAGIIMMFEGLPYLTMPGQTKELMLKIREIDDTSLRFIGLVMFLIGFTLAALSQT